MHLLYGVTGSGKTEVYLQSIASCPTRGEQALAAPGNCPTPQTLSRFESRFAAPIVTLHSGMGDAQRIAYTPPARAVQPSYWAPVRPYSCRSRDWVCRSSTRSTTPPSHNRRVALLRPGFGHKAGQFEQCPVVLGSATPSLESWHNAERGRYRRHTLQAEPGRGCCPAAADRYQRTGTVSRLIFELLQRIDSTLRAGHQVMVFLNRRGFAAALMCHDCGWSSAALIAMHG